MFFSGRVHEPKRPRVNDVIDGDVDEIIGASVCTWPIGVAECELLRTHPACPRGTLHHPEGEVEGSGGTSASKYFRL